MAVSYLARGCAFVVGLAISCTAAWPRAADTANDTESVRAAIARQNPGLVIQSLRPAALPGLYEVLLSGTSGYVTADGRHFVAGDLFEISTLRNLSEEGRKVRRAEVLKSVDWSEAIVFGPQNPKYSIVVFTDVDCPYCRKLHAEVAKLGELGIAVRYLAFPRSGPGTDSWSKMEAVWCSSDRRDALTRAKRGETLAKPADCAAPAVATHYALGETLSVHGTPLIMRDDGAVVGGYMSAAQIAQALDKMSNGAPLARATSK